MSTYDINIAARFSTFRREFIAKGQKEASKLLRCSQSRISDIESGKLPVDFNIVTLMAKEYDLNIDWLATGHGKLKRDDNLAETSLNEIHSQLLSLQRIMAMMSKTVNHLMQRLQDQESEIAELKAQTNKKSAKARV